MQKEFGAWNLAVAIERAECMSEPPKNSIIRKQVIDHTADGLYKLMCHLEENHH